jgi:hypothetical protein
MRTEAEIRQAMEDYLPRYYVEFNIAVNILDQEAAEITQLNYDINDVLAQFFIDTATWGLARWESIFGLSTDVTKPIEERRSVIKSRMRGTGTVTIAMIKSVVEAYDQGAVEVTEQPGLYQVTIKFVETIGALPNINDLKRAIREILPAHLEAKYEYRYLLIREIHGVMTINTLQNTKLTDFAPFVPL